MRKTTRQKRGLDAYRRGLLVETLVATLYRLRGWRIIKKRWRNPFVELDLIVRKNKTIRVIEIKYRAHDEQVYDLVSRLQGKLVQATSLWLSRSRYQDCEIIVHVVGPRLWQWRHFPIDPISSQKKSRGG